MSSIEDIKMMKFNSMYTFHRAALRFHADAKKSAESMLKTSKEKSNK